MADALAWVVVNRRGDLLTSTLGGTRREAIQRMVGREPGWQNRWRYWKRQGCCCIRVEVSAVR